MKRLRLLLCTLCALAIRHLRATETYATFYGESYRGKPMAWHGHPFNPDADTCATWFYPFGSVLKIKSGRRFVYVRVTDRGPSLDRVNKGIVIDLSASAFAMLASLRVGKIPVTIELISKP